MNLAPCTPDYGEEHAEEHSWLQIKAVLSTPQRRFRNIVTKPSASRMALRPSVDPTRGPSNASGDTEYPVLYSTVCVQTADSLPAAMMLYLILLITAVCSSVCGTSQDGDTKHQMLCKIRESCKDTDLTKSNPNDTSPANDLCRAAEDDLKSLDPSTCESLIARETYGQGDNEDPEQPDSEDGQIFDLIKKLLSREIEDQTDNDQPEQPDNVNRQTTHTDPAPPALSKRGNYFSDCSQIRTALKLYDKVSSGVHKILPVGLSSPISVYCDQTTDGGGWTVIQKRFDGSVDFNRPYDDYRYGFGSAKGEYWLGLENMYRLTNQHKYTLHVQLKDWENVPKYAKYSSFSVGSSSSNYRLSVSGYTGTAGDGFSDGSSKPYLSGQAFSARGVDRDAWSSGSCAGDSISLSGGWWYKSCAWSALNGPYLRPSDRTDHSGWGIYWHHFGGSYKRYLKRSKMMKSNIIREIKVREGLCRVATTTTVMQGEAISFCESYP
ncbi:hypothetical protein Bbelb_314080 [Branchiostoma belcheri]|nr:hypothetical protein Bbelb_314080 [Branchiostoma belcheri]